MAGKKYGIDTDPFDKETGDAMDEFVKSEQAREWSYEILKIKYEHLKEVTLKNLPDLWPALQFSIAVKTILNIKGLDLPFIGIILGPPSSMKSVAVDLFKGYKHTYYTDNFSPRSLVSHNSGKSEKELRKIDLLPKMRNRHFLTPELSPMFSAKEDDLHHAIGILTRIADGQGYQSDSGAQGHRGYDGTMLFTWTGAAVDIPYKVHKLLSYLGPKLYFFRIPFVEKTESEYFERRDDDFHVKKQGIKSALFEYLYYFEMNPDIVIEEEQDTESIIWNGQDTTEYDIDNEDGMLPKIEMHPENDNPEAHRMIIRLSMMLAHLRASVVVWDAGTQGSDYNYTFAHIEEASRAIEQMRNLARGNALSQGRLSLTIDEDIPQVIHTVLSTASNERVKLFELLIAHHGVLTANIICQSFDISPHTARKTMTEMKAIKLVDDITGKPNTAGHNNPEMTIQLKSKFGWFLTPEFKELRDKFFISSDMLARIYPPRTHQKQENGEQTDESITQEGMHDNIPYNARNDPVGGGEKPANISEAISQPRPIEPNGAHYERKGLSNIFRCLDCELESFQAAIENHICVALQEQKQTKEKQTELQSEPEEQPEQGLQGLQEHPNKNKLAEMAEANESGNGVMFGNKMEQDQK